MDCFFQSGTSPGVSTASARFNTGHNTQVLFEQMGVEVLEEIPKTPHRMAGVTNVASWDRCSASMGCAALDSFHLSVLLSHITSVADLFTRSQSSEACRLAAIATLRMVYLKSLRLSLR